MKQEKNSKQDQYPQVMEKIAGNTTRVTLFIWILQLRESYDNWLTEGIVFKKNKSFPLLQTLQTGRKHLQKNYINNNKTMTYVANRSWALGPFPGRAHQAMPFTRAGWDRECRHLQHPPRQPQSFTVSSLAQVSRILPVGSHFILTTVSCWI